MRQEAMLAKIEDVLVQGSSTDPPAYTLILGAGASAGLVPTAKEMLGLPDPRTNQVHERSIPVWLAEKRGATVTPDARTECCREFWCKFPEQNTANDKCKTIEFSRDGGDRYARCPGRPRSQGAVQPWHFLGSEGRPLQGDCRLCRRHRHTRRAGGPRSQGTRSSCPDLVDLALAVSAAPL
jgi:hypothetical protein